MLSKVLMAILVGLLTLVLIIMILLAAYCISKYRLRQDSTEETEHVPNGAPASTNVSSAAPKHAALDKRDSDLVEMKGETRQHTEQDSSGDSGPSSDQSQHSYSDSNDTERQNKMHVQA